jgi:hypothetical protein
MRGRGRGRADRCGKITGLQAECLSLPLAEFPVPWSYPCGRMLLVTTRPMSSVPQRARHGSCRTISCSASAITESRRRQRSKHGFDRHAETQQLIVLAGQAVEL